MRRIDNMVGHQMAAAMTKADQTKQVMLSFLRLQFYRAPALVVRTLTLRPTRYK